ncbi:uncharacterized protein LOC127755422 [Oryza glaberrima]|uniref:uncharacterized protein LOC127755422 n=1 Tax=Oryza glaberrima TaxID=4538 RepID=UPI00224C5B56|nr:uncharacterized protein LOC127755422 [Oryza glaberrima]
MSFLSVLDFARSSSVSEIRGILHTCSPWGPSCSCWCCSHSLRGIESTPFSGLHTARLGVAAAAGVDTYVPERGQRGHLLRGASMYLDAIVLPLPDGAVGLLWHGSVREERKKKRSRKKNSVRGILSLLSRTCTSAPRSTGGADDWRWQRGGCGGGWDGPTWRRSGWGNVEEGGASDHGGRRQRMQMVVGGCDAVPSPNSDDIIHILGGYAVDR